jgi:hypothetical protein
VSRHISLSWRTVLHGINKLTQLNMITDEYNVIIFIRKCRISYLMTIHWTIFVYYKVVKYVSRSYHSAWASCHGDVQKYSKSCFIQHWMIWTALLTGNWPRGPLNFTIPSLAAPSTDYENSKSPRVTYFAFKFSAETKRMYQASRHSQHVRESL